MDNIWSICLLYISMIPANSFKKFIDTERLVEERGRSSKTQCMLDIVNALKGVFNNYDIDTRKFAWGKLVAVDGEKQLHKLLQSPTQPVSMSNFVKLVQKS